MLVLIYLILILILGRIIIFLNYSLIVLSYKIYFLNYFRDLEIILTVWNFFFLWIVVLISLRVIFFSFSYIRRLIVRNFLLLYLSFVFSIVWLILRRNFYWIMLGWDGLGVVSFLLILFYINHERINNGLFTLFQNRLGDIFFVLFIVGIVNLEIQINLILNWLILSLIIGSIVKRAQFPFNSWLLAAIRAPTPISSLVHSSTLVVAGVYILLQFSYCLTDELAMLKYLSLFRLVIRSFGLINESDIKKLIAYSTINHVALMLYIIRIELFKIVYFHLNIHAIFKSIIFICFGFVILRSYHSQDKRLISLANLNPLIKIIYYFSRLCLGGLPFLRGFFSKDFIIEKIIIVRVEIIWIVFLLFFLSLRIYYSLKLINLGYHVCSLNIIEKNLLGRFRVIIIVIIIILVVNLYLTLILSLSLEFVSIKLFIYLGVIFFFYLSLRRNLNFKWNSYNKLINFKEIWSLHWYNLDKFIYWNIITIVNIIMFMNNFKLILITNWWIIILWIILFYKKSFKSVVLKKLRIYLYFLWCLAYIIFVNKVRIRILL